MNEVTWQTDPEFIGADHAERACIGDYELVVFDLPADRASPAVIGWELFGPPRHQELIATGDAKTFRGREGRGRDCLRQALGLRTRCRAPVISLTDKKSVLTHIHEQ